MSEHTPASDKFWPLLNAACDDCLDESHIQDLADVLDSDATARTTYIDHVELLVHLRFLSRAERACELSLAQVEAAIAESRPAGVLPSIAVPSSGSVHASAAYSLGSWSLSYLVASILVGVGLCVASLVHVPNADRFATNAPSSISPSRAPAGERVGQITGSFDCKWADPATRTPNGVPVYIGRRYALASGCLQITYSTGAKVILEGPCVYRVDSPRSGFLEIGRLTAIVESRELRVERKGSVDSGQWSVAGGRNLGHSSPQSLASSPSSNPQSLIPNPSLPSPLAPRPSALFTITTPTAIVTDLGTEFGVEVEKSGTTRSHVFKGRVQVRSSNSNSRGPTARGGAASQSGSADVDQFVELVANESASVQADGNGIVKTTRIAGRLPVQFVRAMPRAGSRVRGQDTNSGETANASAELGESATYACAVNAAGKVIDYSPTIADTVHAFLQGEGKLTDLGALEPGESFPTIRQAAERIAVIAANEPARAFLHIPGKGKKALGTLGGPTSRATYINLAGQVVGYSTTAAGATHAFLYCGGKMHDLGTLGGDISYATGINASGSVVGASRTAGGVTHAFLYTRGGGMRDLGTLGGAKANSWALAIGDDGRVSGCSEVEGGRSHAFYYSDYSDEKGIHDMGDIGDGVGHIICCHDGHMDINTWPPAAPDSAFRNKTSAPQSPDTREKGRTSP